MRRELAHWRRHPAQMAPASFRWRLASWIQICKPSCVPRIRLVFLTRKSSQNSRQMGHSPHLTLRRAGSWHGWNGKILDRQSSRTCATPSDLPADSQKEDPVNEQSLEYDKLVSQFAIRDVLCRYCRGVDRRDWSLVRGAFHPDAYDDHGVYRGNVDGFIDFLAERHAFVTMSMHHIGNVLVEFSGPDRAMAETYCLAFQRYAPGGESIRAAITGGKSTASSDE